MKLTNKEQEILKQRKRVADIDTIIIKEFGRMIRPRESALLYRLSLWNTKRKIGKLDVRYPEKTYYILDKLTYKLEDLIDQRIGLRNRVIIARIHAIGTELIDTIETTFTFEACKANTALAGCVEMYSFEEGFGYDTRDFVKSDKSRKGMFK